jgi:hypothetical protein
VLEAAFWGIVTAGSLWVGAALASYARLGQRAVGLAMAFGAGALIAAVAYELVIDAFDTDLRLASLGFACAGLTFYVEDTLPASSPCSASPSGSATSELCARPEAHQRETSGRAIFPRGVGFAGAGYSQVRSSGRVRQVGPPSPFFEISSPR